MAILRMTDFYIGKKFQPSSAIKISADRYLEIKKNRNLIVGMLEISELIGVVSECLYQHENEILQVSLRQCFTDNFADERDFSFLRKRINVVILAVLTAIKAYRDQTCLILSRNEAFSEDDLEKFNELLKIEYDRSLNFRLIENLKNHAQHARLPTHAFGLSASKFVRGGPGEGGPSLQVSTVTVNLVVEELLRYGEKIQAPVRSELLKMCKPDIDLKAAIRSYCASLASAHIQFFTFLDERRRFSENELRKVVTEYCDSFNESKVDEFVYLFSIKDGVGDECAFIGSKIIDRLESRRAENMRNYRKKVVSQELINSNNVALLEFEDLWVGRY